MVRVQELVGSFRSAARARPGGLLEWHACFRVAMLKGVGGKGIPVREGFLVKGVPM